MIMTRADTLSDFVKENYEILCESPLLQRARIVFGTTENFNTGAYLLPDGSLLDFTSESGRLSHGDISLSMTDEELLQGPGEHIDEPLFAKRKMLGLGAIRLVPECGGIELSQPPTEVQIEMIRLFFTHTSYSNIWVEITGGEKKAFISTNGGVLEALDFLNQTFATNMKQTVIE